MSVFDTVSQSPRMLRLCVFLKCVFVFRSQSEWPVQSLRESETLPGSFPEFDRADIHTLASLLKLFRDTTAEGVQG